MDRSSFIRAGQYRSPWRVVAGFLLRSRETQAERARRKSEEIEQLRRFSQQQQRSLEQAHEEHAELKRQLARLQIENQQLRKQPPVLPLSTEILESCFGLFKQLERQHSKGGFTSSLAAFGALLKPATPESIRSDFARVSVKQTRTWATKNLGQTVASKRQTAYAESKTAA